MHKYEPKQKKQSKSVEKKMWIKQEQINLLLYNNNQLHLSKQTLGKTHNLEREKPKSSLGSYLHDQRYSIDLMTSNTKIPLTNWLDKVKVKQKPSKSHFIYHTIIGKGGFGKVWKVQDKKTGQIMAMKEMYKAVILSKKSIESVLNEKQLLTKLKNKFIVNMIQAFQDRDTLYLLMDLMPGGDLRYHICRKHKFTEQEVRFFAACIFMGLEYLHSQNVIHRDVKPENLVFNNKGYLHITDLGIAKVLREDNFMDTSGTPGYMAPQIMCKQNHSYQVDYYALGVIIYELMIGRRPYIGKSRKEIRQQVLAHQTIIKKSQIPEGWSIEAADFINKLLQRKPMLRLGWGGAQEVKTHCWLKDFPWDKLSTQQLESPFAIYSQFNPSEVRFQKTKQDEEMSALIKQNMMLLRKGEVQQLFDGYSFYEEHKECQIYTTSSELGRRRQSANYQ